MARNHLPAAIPLWREHLPLPPRLLIGFIVAVAAVLLIATFSYRSSMERAGMVVRINDTMEVLSQLQSVLTTLQNAETSQRGFLLTSADEYLIPYKASRAHLQSEFTALRKLTADNASQQRRLDQLIPLVDEKVGEMNQTIDFLRGGNTRAAIDIVMTNRGHTLMNDIRKILVDMQVTEQGLLDERRRQWEAAANFANWFAWASSALLLFLISASALMTARDHRESESKSRIKSGLMGLSARMQGEQNLDALGRNVLEHLAGCLGFQVGAVYLAQDDGRCKRFGGYALSDERLKDSLRDAESLVGQAIAERRMLHVRDLPDDYLPVSSGLGHGKPRELIVIPADTDGKIHAVIELGFFRAVNQEDVELLAGASESLAVAVRSAKDRSRLEALLEESQRQSEELQAQQEELRVSNEELEQQSRILRESQVQMDAQQSELEQTNQQLQQQSHLLENQNDELLRIQTALTDKAREIEQASKYKSEFLANMSHELRTPLNSTLILAKLLADNKHGNLTDEEVKYAQTISSAGSDLLALINDILDLAKIEAGQASVSIERVPVRNAIQAVFDPLRPLARQKGLQLEAIVDESVPGIIETDPLRLGQILKNLLSNGLKFTNEGSVTLHLFASPDGSLSFAVRDTGIGIPESQQALIFEAFRQADGSTGRKYGGTGLGLSISRNLAHLLGGELSVSSLPGEGSIFTLMLPSSLGLATPARPAAVPGHDLLPPVPTPVAPSAHMLDDREHLDAGTRTMLVIEDDVRFAGILSGLAHEMSFQCVLTHTAAEGLAAASQYSPSAILLDMNLPDYSGLAVLDQLKRDPRTRHVPVHVISVADYSQEALGRGAVGYALKPVRREELVLAFQRLEARFSQGMRHVLVVEDDERQRESIRQLLDNGDIEITTVDSAFVALDLLVGTTYDCMVMDLNLPGLSGYELLERMAGQDDIAFPPVIVYTGRSLSSSEEQQLRRFSKSIIIKDARSPERLLDEVTLFLHQVESTLPADRRRMLKLARDRDSRFEGRTILIVEDDVRNVFALSSVLEPTGARVAIARNGIEALAALEAAQAHGAPAIDLILMDIMMPEMDGLTAMREIRRRREWDRLPIIALTAKAMKDDQEKCLSAGANDYMAKPLDVDKLLSLVRVWMPK